MATVNEKMTALADEIRELSGTTDTKSLDEMKVDVDAANTEITEQTELIAQIATALEGKAGGGTVLPTLDNPAVAADILSGKEAIDGEGNVIAGTIATRTSSNLTASGATVTVPAGYYASQATKSVATATQATPSVSIDANGKITASTTQTAGYVSAGTKTGTKQMTTQAAKTITPTTSAQTAVASGVYTTGAVTVAAIPSNYIIPSGTKTITTNGTHDVKSYASATVNVTSTGEDVTDETNAYTTKLASLETAVTTLETELAGKASGGSGNNIIETCSVTANMACPLSVTKYENGAFTAGWLEQNDNYLYSGTIDNVPCGSAICVDTLGSYDISAIGAEKMIDLNGFLQIFKITAAAGETVTLSAAYND